METENINQQPASPAGPPPVERTPVTPLPVEQTPVEKLASDAYAHTTEAAGALRRGQIMQNSEIDALADSDDRLIALLSYATQILIPVVMPIIVLLSESSKKRPFQRYHAMQSLALVVLFWGLIVLTAMVTTVMQIVPFIGFMIGLMMACMVPLAWFAQAMMLLYYGFQSYKGRRFAVPGLTSFLRDQGWL
jgi:uncharacterized membrane protein